eukprot:m.44035 g.44035  ORF g.44035 m.44035 type:complete len:280 (-) comp12989_c0_seq1:176-1015(-)
MRQGISSHDSLRPAASLLSADSPVAVTSPSGSSQRSRPIDIQRTTSSSTAEQTTASSLDGFIATPQPSSTSSCSPTPPKSAKRKLVRGGAPPPSTGLLKISSLSESHSFTPTRSMMTISENTTVDYSSRCGTDDPQVLAELRRLSELRRNALSAISAAPRHDWLVIEFQQACKQLKHSIDLNSATLPLRALLTDQITKDLHELGLPMDPDTDTYVPDNVMSFLENFLDEADLERLRDAVESLMSPLEPGQASLGLDSLSGGDGVNAMELMAKLHALSLR